MIRLIYKYFFVADFCSRKQEEEERVHGPVGAQGRADGRGKPRVPQEGRRSGGLEQQPGQPDPEAPGYRRQNPSSTHQALEQVKKRSGGSLHFFILLY